MFHFGQPPILFLNSVVHRAPTATGFEVHKLIKTRSAKFVLDQNDPQRHTGSVWTGETTRFGVQLLLDPRQWRFSFSSQLLLQSFLWNFLQGSLFLPLTWASFANSDFYDRVAAVIWGLTLAVSSHEQPPDLTKWPRLEIWLTAVLISYIKK